MITDKMKNLVINGSAIRAMFEDGKNLKAKLGEENVFDFSLGNPSIVPPATVKQAILDILENEPEMFVHGYMSNSGYEDVRDRTAQYINSQHGTSFTRDNIVMTVGAASALNIAMKVILDPGDEVVLIAPYFGEYNNYISNFDGVPVVVSPDYERFSINFDELEKKISPKTKLMIINTPNNPTGAVYTEDDLTRLAALLTKKQQEFGTTIYLISDEPYREIAFGGLKVPYLTKFYPNTFVAYSYSKSLSLPGERIGYLVTSSEMEGFADTMDALNVANRILGYVNAPSLMQRVAGRCVGQTSDLSVYEENMELLYNALTEYGYDIIKPKGTFYMFPKCFIADDKEFCAAAKEFGLVIVPGSSFACPGYFRIAFCVDKQTVINSLPSFKKLAEKYTSVK